MIVEMRKAFVLARLADRDRLLDVLRDLGVMHLAPVDPAKAVAKSETLRQIDHLDRAIQILTDIAPSGSAPAAGAIEAAERVLQMQRDEAEKRSRLTTLARQTERLEMWGEVRLEQFARLAESGLDVRFYAADADQTESFQADLVQVVHELPPKRSLVAVVVRDRQAQVPDGAERIELPQTDRPTIRAEAKQIDQALKAHAQQLADLAGKLPEMVAAKSELQTLADYAIAQAGGWTNDDLFAVQGWVPADPADTLDADVATADLEAVVRVQDPAEDDDVPTLIRYPRWAGPIKALFDMLGTIPGFREFDLSGFFMIAMPIFVAMLIGDAGYGLVFILGWVAFYRKLVGKAGRPAAYLILIFSVMTVLWGVLTANYFGVTPETVAKIAGFTKAQGTQEIGDVTAMLGSAAGTWAWLGKTMFKAAPLYRVDAEEARNIIMKISFMLGCLHLVAGQLRQALGRWPDIRFLSNVGWAVVLPGMLGVIWQMFFVGIDNAWPQWVFIVIALGLLMVVLFSYPSKNLLKMLGLGLLANMMPLVNTFSDTMSYIRLMAVGLASYYIAYSFNLLGSQVAEGSHWLLAVPVLLFGHGLNIGLGIIAVFAHGVRLNMLEFSNNAGVQWSGHAYRPFAKVAT